MKFAWYEWIPFQRWRVVGVVPSADEIPDVLPRNGVVAVNDAGHQKWLVFDCPCRSGHRIMINADKRRLPVWRLDIDSKNRLSISPSISFEGDTRYCHYFVRKGRTVWT